MKKSSIFLFSILILVLESCSIAEGIFKAGFGLGIFVVAAVIALVLYLVSRSRK